MAAANIEGFEYSLLLFVNPQVPDFQNKVKYDPS